MKQTNIIHLARYAHQFHNFGEQQRFVQSIYGPKEWQVASYTGTSVIHAEEGSNIELRDDEPALKEICDLLEESHNKVRFSSFST